MDLLSRLSIFVVYVLTAVAIGTVAWVAGRFYATTSATDSQTAAVLAGQTPVAVPPSGPPPGVHVDQLFAQRAQIARLQKLLGEKTELLEQKNRLLEEKTREQVTLQSDLSEAIAMIEAMMADQQARDDPPQDPEDEQLRADLERLRDERDRNAVLAELLEEDLEALRLQLVATDQQIDHLQQQSELETALLMAEIRSLEAVVTDTLARLGESAVPALTDLLDDPRPRVRRWAAAVLGEIGPAAQDAVPALIDARTDDDAEVRLSVQRALESIQPGR